MMLPIVLALAASPASADDVKPASALRVLSYNVLLDGGDNKATLELLAASNADVLLLQEVTPAWRTRIEQRKELAALSHRLWNAKPGAYGSAILSRFPLTKLKRIDGGTAWTFALCADVAPSPSSSKPARVCSVHLKSSRSVFAAGVGDPLKAFDDNQRLRERQWSALMAYVEKSDPVILGGDFNTAEVEPLYAVFRKRVRDPFRERAWIDPGFTYPVRPYPKETIASILPAVPVLRLDYLFVVGDGVDVDVAVVDGGGSDHRAVRGDFTLR